MRSIFPVSAAFIFILSPMVHGTELQVILKNNVFYAPATGPYVELEMLIPCEGMSLVKNEKGIYTCAVQVLLVFKRGNTIFNYDKYTLHGEIDTSQKGIAILDTKRYTLPPGFYILNAIFTDMNSQRQQKIDQQVNIGWDGNKVGFSDILLSRSAIKVDNDGKTTDGTSLAKEFIKSGLYLLPLVTNYFPADMNTFRFYSELYNTNNTGDNVLLFRYSIRNLEIGEPLGHYSSYRKIAAQPVVPLFGEMDISDLLSGNYELVLQVVDRKNDLICEKKLSFQRNKPDKDKGSLVADDLIDQMDVVELHYQLRTLYPITDYKEAMKIKNLMRSVDSLKQFLLQFWVSKDSIRPYLAWTKYEAQVSKANELFGSTIFYGFETDRGRVFLQYGPPNQLDNVSSEPAAYPYQIWEYYNIPGQGEAKFVFYDPNNTANDYELIHSTARDEVSNNNWEKLVYQSDGTVTSSDLSPLKPNSWGAKATQLYQNP